MSFRLLGSYETIAAIDRLIKEARREVLIVSPYFNMESKASLMRTLRLALDHKLKVTMLIREDYNKDLAWDVLTEFVELGMKVQKVPNLHAKLYWSDAGAVVASINMLTTSFESSIEAGLLALDETARGQVLEFIQREVQPRHEVDLRRRPPPVSHRVPGREPVSERSTRSRGSDSGYCIRCAATLPLNLAKPLCFDCHASWADFKKPDYPERYCHECGAEVRTSKAKPSCGACYSRA